MTSQQNVPDKKVSNILESYRQMISNIHEALSLAGVPKRLLWFYTFYFPDLGDLLPEDIINFYREIRKRIVIYLHEIGFSNREIARRLGGGSYHIVHDILSQHGVVDLASPSEVKVKKNKEAKKNV